MSSLIVRNANIYTPLDAGTPSAGQEQRRLAVYPKGSLLVRDGLIDAVGGDDEVSQTIRDGENLSEIDAGGRCLIPGFVDPHTHICFAERREAEFSLRMQGVPYLEILSKGGGILSSVQAVEGASDDELYLMTRRHAESALQYGTTTLEIKSGYGLTTASELKMLRVIDRLAREGVQDIVPTFLGAHAVPKAFRDDPDAFIQHIIDDMLPAVLEQGIAEQCDIFCEKGVFSLSQSRRLLAAAQAAGMRVKLHADEVHDLGGAGLAAEIGAVSADHLLAASDGSLQAMRDAGVVATLLPATAYCLRKPYARARFMIDSKLPVALATDCNPGSSYTESMPFVISLAVINMAMTAEEALVAATLNSAYAIGMAKRTGSLEPGKQADFLLLDGLSPAILPYHAGCNPVAAVFKKGRRIDHIPAKETTSRSRIVER